MNNKALTQSLSAATLILSLGFAGTANSLTVRDIGFTGISGGIPASQLSDLAWDQASDRWFAIGDSADQLYELDLSIDPNSGVVSSASVSSATTLLDETGAVIVGADFEGLSHGPSGSLLLSDESDQSLYRYDLTGGVALQAQRPADDPQLGRFANTQGNLGLEALTFAGSMAWTANEEALSTDGPTANNAVPNGTLVRLQAMDSNLNGLAQYAYQVTPLANSAAGNQAGVVAMLALDNGDLLVLERELDSSVFPSFTNRLFRVDLSGADQVQGISNLDGTENLVGKELLWQRSFFNANFEGIALGDLLNTGERSLVLVADNGGSGFLAHGVYALALDGLITASEPGNFALLSLLFGGLVFVRRRKRAAKHC